MTIATDVGRRIRTLREQQGHSQERLADLAKIHRTYLSGVESGSRNPTIDVLGRIAKALGVSPAALLEDRK